MDNLAYERGLTTDIFLVAWGMAFYRDYRRLPKIDEIPEKGQIRLGKKIFEYLDYRDKFHPDLHDIYIYVGCLEDHWIQRNPYPDGLDISIKKKIGQTLSDKISLELLEEEILVRTLGRELQDI